MSHAGRRRGPLAGLIAGHTVSLTGNMLTLIAVPLYVLATTNSAAATGIAGACATAPVIMGGAFGGVFVDRIGYRRASIIADLFSGTAIVAVPVLAMTVGLPFWGLLRWCSWRGCWTPRPDRPVGAAARGGGHRGGPARTRRRALRGQ